MVRLAGRPAPFFALDDQFGVRRAVDDYVGGSLIIVFFPFAFTPICSSELRELSELAAQSPRIPPSRERGPANVSARNAASRVPAEPQTVAISVDSKYTLRALAEHRSLDGLSVLSDFWPHGKVSARYGAFDARTGRAGRGTIVVDGRGIVRRAELSDPGRARDLSAWWQYAARIGPMGA